MASGNGFTPTEKRIMDVLGDWQPHHHSDLRKCLDDELAADGALNVHLTYLRDKIESKGSTIICQLIGRSRHYRLIRLVSSPYDGRTS